MLWIYIKKKVSFSCIARAAIVDHSFVWLSRNDRRYSSVSLSNVVRRPNLRGIYHVECVCAYYFNVFCKKAKTKTTTKKTTQKRTLHCSDKIAYKRYFMLEECMWKPEQPITYTTHISQTNVLITYSRRTNTTLWHIYTFRRPQQYQVPDKEEKKKRKNTTDKQNWFCCSTDIQEEEIKHTNISAYVPVWMK